jgi:hypothetical protein
MFPLPARNLVVHDACRPGTYQSDAYQPFGALPVKTANVIVESTLVGGPRFAAGDVGGEVRIFVQHSRCFQPEQHRHHHQVARAERTIEPVGIAKAIGKFVQPITDAILDER